MNRSSLLSGYHRRGGAAVRSVFRPGRSLLVRMVIGGLCLCAAVSADIPLSGEQDDVYGRDDYLVNRDIEVRPGKTLVFAPGSVIRFQRYSGLVVKGSLICKGTPEAPIVFTSVNDRPADSENPERPLPFDWNGINVLSSASRIEFEHVRISYGSFGLQVASRETEVFLEDVVFHDNGNTALTLCDSVLAIADNTPVTISSRPVPVAAPPAADSSTRAALDFRVASPDRHSRPGLVAVRVGCGALALGGGVLWAVCAIQANAYHDEYHNPDLSPASVRQMARVRDQFRAAAMVGSALTIAGLAGFTITLFF